MQTLVDLMMHRTSIADQTHHGQEPNTNVLGK